MKKIFECEWNEKDLGEGWFSKEHLELCLYGKEHTQRNLLTVKESDYIKREDIQEVLDVYEYGKKLSNKTKWEDMMWKVIKNLAEKVR